MEKNITKEDLLKAQSELFEAEERLVDAKRQ